jgi:predicted regulator of Ras-like GTPase activity (Roadblock/LC7/MglB family)
MDGDMLASLEELRKTPGVVAVWLAQTTGAVLGGVVPTGVPSGGLTAVVAAAGRILSTVEADVVELEYQGGQLRVDVVEAAVLVVLTAPGADLAWARLSCEVARARLREARRTATRTA